MGVYDSSLTRVQPVINELLDRSPNGQPWVGDLWELATRSRPGEVVEKPADVGTLLPSETPLDRPARIGKVFERTVAPPAAFLRWLVANPARMNLRDPINFGAKSKSSREWRRKLFSQDAVLVNEARQEAERQLTKRAAQRGRQKWWAFEGFSHIDCCLVSDKGVLFIEGKRTESVSPSTLWYTERSQLWRNVEVAQEFAQGKHFGVILAVEAERDGAAALNAAAESLEGSSPHLSADQQREFDRHLLGFVTWSGVVSHFGLPSACLLDRVVIGGGTA